MPICNCFSSGLQVRQAGRVDAYMKSVLGHCAANCVGGSGEGDSALPMILVDLVLL